MTSCCSILLKRGGPGAALLVAAQGCYGNARGGTGVRSERTNRVMNVKSALIVAVLCFPLLFGCGKKEEQKIPVLPAAPEHSLHRDEAQLPNYDGLIEEYRSILAEDPNSLAAIVALGNAYFDDRQWKRAIMMYEHALLLDPRNADVRTDMATAYRNIGMVDRALVEYRTAIEHDPGHLNARYNQGMIYAHDKRDFRAAIHIWEELLKLAPSYPQADNIKSGIATFRKALKKGPQ